MKKLNWIEITSLYIGVIMGAGFASGRECWQFLGVFGKRGYLGAVLCTCIFIMLACMLTYIARSKGTADLGRLISPVDNKAVYEIIGWILAAIYYSIIKAKFHPTSVCRLLLLSLLLMLFSHLVMSNSL